MEFKDRLRQLRKERKMTQGELAGHLDYGYTAITNYESGRNEPHIRELNILADLFGISVDYLIGRSEERNELLKAPGQDLSQIDDYLEPLKVWAALNSEIMKLNYRKKNNPKQINVLDYTVIYALQKILQESEGGAEE